MIKAMATPEGVSCYYRVCESKAFFHGIEVLHKRLGKEQEATKQDWKVEMISNVFHCYLLWWRSS
jgi:hypothetical protein